MPHPSRRQIYFLFATEANTNGAQANHHGFFNSAMAGLKTCTYIHTYIEDVIKRRELTKCLLVPADH